MVAAIGLDAKARDRAFNKLTAWLRDAKVSLSMEAEISFLGLELCDRPDEATKMFVTSIEQALAADGYKEIATELVRHLVEPRSEWIPASPTACSFTRSSEPRTRRRVFSLASALSDVSVRTSATPSTRLRASSVVNESDSHVQYILARVLFSIAERSPAAQARQIYAELTRELMSAIEAGADRQTRISFLQILEKVPVERDRRHAAHIAGIIQDALCDAGRDDEVRQFLTQYLSKVCESLEATERSRVHTDLARRLATILLSSPSSKDRTVLATTLGAIANYLARSDVSHASQPVVQIFRKTLSAEKDAEVRATLAWGLAHGLGRSVGAEAAEILQPVLSDLIESLRGASRNEVKARLVRGLMALAVRVPPDQAISAVRFLAAYLNQQGDQFPEDSSGISLMEYIPSDTWPEASDATATSKLVLAAITQEKDVNFRHSLVSTLIFITYFMDPFDVNEACRIHSRELVSQTTTKSRRTSVVPAFYYENALSAVASHADRSAASEISRLLLDSIRPDGNAQRREELVSIIVAAGKRGPGRGDEHMGRTLEVVRHRTKE